MNTSPDPSQSENTYVLDAESAREFDRLHQQLMAEMLSDNFCAVGFLMTVWGNKPE